MNLEIEEWRAELQRRAAAEGLSLSEFLLRESESAAPPISTELFERLKRLPRIDLGMSGADLVREAREERMKYLDELFDDLQNRR